MPSIDEEIPLARIVSRHEDWRRSVNHTQTNAKEGKRVELLKKNTRLESFRRKEKDFQFRPDINKGGLGRIRKAEITITRRT